MAGRNRAYRYTLSNGSRDLRDDPRPVMVRDFHEDPRSVMVRDFHGDPRSGMLQGSRPLPPHPSVLEEELAIQREEMRRIVAENRQLALDNGIIKGDLITNKDEINRLSQIIPQLRADKELQARELIQNGLKLESELRAAEPLKTEVMQLRVDAEKLDASRKELAAQILTLTQDLTRLQAENKRLPDMKADMDGLHRELARAREAFEYEKKAQAEQMELKQAMEKNLISLARELEKLRADSERVRPLGGAYGALKGSAEMGYAGTSFGDGFGGAWGAYDRYGPPRH